MKIQPQSNNAITIIMDEITRTGYCDPRGYK